MYLPNKYTTWYNNIIAKARLRVNHLGYTEKHHIIPKSLGGTDEPSNLIRLTAREHFICHLLLTQMTDGLDKSKMLNAAFMMATNKNSNQDRYKITSRTYETLKSKWSARHISEDTRWKNGSANRGKKLPPRTAEHSAKLAFSKSEETKQKMSLSRIGKSWGYKHTPETKAKMSKAAAGRIPVLKTCEHCGKQTTINNHNRWHGTNCKKQ